MTTSTCVEGSRGCREKVFFTRRQLEEHLLVKSNAYKVELQQIQMEKGGIHRRAKLRESKSRSYCKYMATLPALCKYYTTVTTETQNMMEVKQTVIKENDKSITVWSVSI